MPAHKIGGFTYQEIRTADAVLVEQCDCYRQRKALTELNAPLAGEWIKAGRPQSWVARQVPEKEWPCFDAALANGAAQRI